MLHMFSYFIAGASMVVFLALWFITSYREMFRKKNELNLATEQVKLHASLYMKEKYGPNELCIKKMVETSCMVYGETAKNYNKTLKKAMNRIPGLIMGFYAVSEKIDL